MTKGQRIKYLREKKKLTQEELAKLLGTTKQTISKYEKDIVTNIPSDRIEELSVVLNSTPEYILGWEQVKKNNNAISDIVIRMRTDANFLSIVEKLNALDEKQLSSIGSLLDTFIQ